MFGLFTFGASYFAQGPGVFVSISAPAEIVTVEASIRRIVALDGHMRRTVRVSSGFRRTVDLEVER